MVESAGSRTPHLRPDSPGRVSRSVIVRRPTDSFLVAHKATTCYPRFMANSTEPTQEIEEVPPPPGDWTVTVDGIESEPVSNDQRLDDFNRHYEAIQATMARQLNTAAANRWELSVDNGTIGYVRPCQASGCVDGRHYFPAYDVAVGRGGQFDLGENQAGWLGLRTEQGLSVGVKVSLDPPVITLLAIDDCGHCDGVGKIFEPVADVHNQVATEAKAIVEYGNRHRTGLEEG